jgi:hypothetical protein
VNDVNTGLPLCQPYHAKRSTLRPMHLCIPTPITHTSQGYKLVPSTDAAAQTTSNQPTTECSGDRLIWMYHTPAQTAPDNHNTPKQSRIIPADSLLPNGHHNCYCSMHHSRRSTHCAAAAVVGRVQPLHFFANSFAMAFSAEPFLNQLICRQQQQQQQQQEQKCISRGSLTPPVNTCHTVRLPLYCP